MPEATYGVTYYPTDISAKLKLDDLPNIKFIRIQWVDLINMVRFRIVSRAYFEKLLASSRPGISLTKALLGLVDRLADGFPRTGEYLYVVDMDTLKVCPYAPGHASVMGYFQEKTPVEGRQDFEVDICPRTILRKVVDDGKRCANTSFLVGFESEFMLLKSLSPLTPVNCGASSMSNAIPAGSVEEACLAEMAEAIQQSGIELHMYHSEAAPGQFEIVTGPLPPLEAADALIHTREIIYNTASKHGLKATFAPKIFPRKSGNAAHAHISIHTSVPSGPSDHPFLSKAEASFLSAVLDRLPSLVALINPTPSSFARMADGTWSGGTYVSWGTDNREAPLRLCCATAPKARNFEIKTIDAMANPYLALAGILGAGISGIKEGKRLEIMDNSGVSSAAQLSDDERAALGIKKRLPLTWNDARKAFEDDLAISQLFGSNFAEKYLSVNQVWAEWLTDEDEDAAMLHLVQNY